MTESTSQRLLIAAGFGIALLLVGTTAAPDVIHVGHFSMASADSNGHPMNWRAITFSKVDKKTNYNLVRRVVENDTTSVVRAVSDGGASGLVRRRRIDPSEYPILSWRWKVNRVLETGDATEKEGDDYPARIYVSFDYDPSNLGFFDRLKYRALKTLGYDQIPTRALNYVWASRVDDGRILPNPYTDWVQMVIVESGPENVGSWVEERRNVRADYRRAFGEAPPPITGIAIMTDTDNTGESATAYYGDISVRAQSKTSADSAEESFSPN